MKTLLALLIFTLAPLAAFQELPAHPDALTYPTFELKIPDRQQARHDLGGATAFIVADRSVPLVEINLMAWGGSYLEAAGKEGLAGLSASMLLNGGTTRLAPMALQEKLDFLSTQVRFNFSETRFSAQLSCLKSNLDESLALFFEMLQSPGFDAERLSIEKQNLLESMRKRNDDTRAMEPRYWSDLLYGRSFHLNRRSTATSVESISANDMRALLAQVLVQGNLVLAISGDIDSKNMAKQLKPYLAKFPKGKRQAEPPRDWRSDAPGLYGVQKDGVNQTRVSLGYLGLEKGSPDQAAVDVMNDVLGGGGFTSRITSRVRSDEGLAYSAGSIYTTGSDRPGQFRAYYQSKNASVAFALKIVLEEIERMRRESISEKELQIAGEGVLAGLLPLFDSPNATANYFARSYMDDEPADKLQRYQKEVRALSRESIQKAANRYLDRSRLIILLTGDLAAVAPGDGKNGSLEEVSGLSLQRLPLYEPLTLQPIQP